MSLSAMDDTYTHGHQEAVLRSHRWRTAENSAAYLTPTLRPGMSLLDVGCGPGTLTLDLARLVAPGRVVGLDRSPEVTEEARARAADAGVRVEFVTGDVYRLRDPDSAFDVVHAHQVLQHLSDPVAALREMRRVLAPGGVLAVRDSDYGGFLWSPPDVGLERWMQLYHQVSARNRGEADAGRRLPGWVRAAGFHGVVVGSSTWTFADAESSSWWSGMWADRVVSSSFSEQALEYGLTTKGELEALAEAWRSWGTRPDAIFVVLHVEVLARR